MGLDREAAKQALSGFTAGRRLSANQIEFIDLVIDHLTGSGIMEPDRLYESPFTDIDHRGVSGLFPDRAWGGERNRCAFRPTRAARSVMSTLGK